jgi:hypothetical protein
MRNWDWWGTYEFLKLFIKQKGHLYPPVNYITKEGFQLGAWIRYQRYLKKIGKLDSEKENFLEKLPYWYWSGQEARKKIQFSKSLKYLNEYISHYGNVWVPKKYITKNGFKLGTWVGTQRYLFRKGILDEWKREILEQIPGWRWNKKQ